MLPHRSLKYYLVRLILWSVLPVWLLAFWLALDRLRHEQAMMAETAQDIAENFATAVDQHLAARLSALSMLAELPAGDEPALGLAYRQA